MTDDETTELIALARTAAELVDIADTAPASYEPDARREVRLARMLLVLARELRAAEGRIEILTSNPHNPNGPAAHVFKRAQEASEALGVTAIGDLPQAAALALAAMRSVCPCDGFDRNPPTDWRTGVRIPHHCDCPLYAIELPDATAAPAAHADAVKVRAELLAASSSRAGT
jgi:hypothetical protein